MKSRILELIDRPTKEIAAQLHDEGYVHQFRGGYLPPDRQVNLRMIEQSVRHYKRVYGGRVGDMVCGG